MIFQAPFFHRGRRLAERKDWESADEGLTALKAKSAGGGLLASIERWREGISRRQGKRYKSPAKAAVLSAVFPGAGQIYARHYFDGLQAFAYVAIFSAATFASYRYETGFDKPMVLTAALGGITGALHIANIWGAQRTAKYRNHRLDENILKQMREDALEIEFNLPPP